MWRPCRSSELIQGLSPAQRPVRSAKPFNGFVSGRRSFQTAFALLGHTISTIPIRRPSAVIRGSTCGSSVRCGMPSFRDRTPLPRLSLPASADTEPAGRPVRTRLPNRQVLDRPAQHLPPAQDLGNRFCFHTSPLAIYDTPFGDNCKVGSQARQAGTPERPHPACTGAAPLWVFRCPQVSLRFEILRLVSAERVRVLRAIRAKPAAVSELAVTLRRDRKAVRRDVFPLLESSGLVSRRDEPKSRRMDAWTSVRTRVIQGWRLLCAFGCGIWAAVCVAGLRARSPRRSFASRLRKPPCEVTKYTGSYAYL